MKDKKRVLLIRPYYEVLKHELGIGFLPYEPLGLLSLKAVLQKEGHEVELYDCLVEHPEKTRYLKEKNVYRCGSEEEDIIKKIKKFKPDVVGISGMFFAQDDSFFQVAELAKQVSPEILVAGGGISASLSPERVLSENKNFDVIIMGEGEETFVELLDNLSDFSRVSGLYFRNQDNKVVSTPPRKLKVNLDELPFPSRDFSKIFNYSKHVGYNWSDEFNWKKSLKRFIYYRIIFLPGIRNIVARYFNHKHRHAPKALFIPHALISTSRGCPHQCTFCSVRRFWHGFYRMRSVANVLEEIDWLVKNGVKELGIVDENFTLFRDRTIEICKAIIDRKYNIRLVANSGLYAPSLDKEMLEYLYKAGLRVLNISIENGDQEFLYKVIKKRYDLEKTKELIRQAKEIGFLTYGYFIFGYPEETKETMMKTFKYAFESGLHKPRFYILQPFPGTEIYEKAMEMGLIEKGLNIFRLRFTTDIPQIETKEFTKQEVKRIFDLANDVLNGKQRYEDVKDNLKEVLAF